MSRVKEIQLKIIPASIATPFVKKHHYSGKVVNNSFLHFGAFLDNELHGVMSFGHSIDKEKTRQLVSGTGWNEFCELNRMAFDDYLPRNSESYCLGWALRMIKKQAPHIKWVISFADGCSCGDGTIYRASNFVLTQIKQNSSIMINDKGEKVATLTMKFNRRDERKNCTMLEGFMLRYIYFTHPKERKNLTCEEIPFSKIKEMGASMYKGVRQNATIKN